MKDSIAWFLASALVVASFVAGMLYGKVSVYEKGAGVKSGQQAAANPQEPVKQELTGEDWERISESGTAVKGEESATVTIVEFTDYECPFCARYYEGAYQDIMEQYVEAGKVRYILRDLPLGFHESAKPAAMAAECAGSQGKYWEMHDVLFEKQDDWVGSPEPDQLFVSYAQDLSLDPDSFEQCYRSEEFAENIASDLAMAQDVGATGTPTFYINGKQLVGAQPFAAFEAIIEEELSN